VPVPGDIQSRLFIDGEFVDGEGRARIPVFDPHDNALITEVAEAKAADIDQAVAAARRAFPEWARLAAADRGRLLLRLADAVEASAEELAHLESMDTGHPIRDTRGLDVVRTALTFRYFGGMADKFQGSVVPVETGFLNYVRREPLGVVGQIVPWNFPLMFTSWKLGPALAAGNTVVLKGRKVVGGVAEGEALVTRQTISGWGGVNPMLGTVTETRHELRGVSFKDKILVFPGAKGSSAWSAMFHMARLAGSAPKALLFNEMTTKVALGAVVMRIPAITDFDRDPLDVIETGDWVVVDADRGVVEVRKAALRTGS